MKKLLAIIALVGFTNALFSQTTTLDKVNCIPGTIGGSVDVSPSGAANYSIPIMVSPGSHGMQPNLSIVYSSQSGNGLLGWGWNLAGISIISRVPKNQYYDNNTDAISLTDNDAFALDGTRLIKDAAGNYYPANNPYTKVEYSGANAGFKVTTQNGITIVYGKEGNSLIIPNGGSIPISWSISSITDAEGNYMQFIYEGSSSTGEYRIREIKYTGNASTLPYNSVKFSYVNRTDVNSIYVAGGRLTQSSLLSAIKVYCDGATTASKDYKFTYGYGQYSKLTGIALTADGLTYNPTIITWGANGNYTTTVSNAGLGNYEDYQLYLGDFNGDGITDIAKLDASNTLSMSIAQSGTTPPLSLSTTFPKPFTHQTVKINDIQALDRDGDGRDELLVHFTVYNSDWVPPLASRYTEKSMGGTQNAQRDYVYKYYWNNGTINLSSDYTNSAYAINNHFYGDFNNDGIIERLTLQNYVVVSCGGLTIPAINAVDIKLLDFDGDGRIDILALAPNGFGAIWEYNGSTFVNRWNSTAAFAQPKDVFVGDFNGDGKSDCLCYSSGSWHLFYSTGTGFIEGDVPNLLNFDPALSSSLQNGINIANAICIDDINNDGKADICQAVDGNVRILISTGSNFSTYSTTISTLTNNTNVFLQTADLNSDGQKEFVFGLHHVNTSYPYQRLDFQNELRNNLSVNSITDGLGNRYAFSYGYFSDHRIFSSSFAKPVFPLQLVRGPWRLVSQLFRDFYDDPTTPVETIKQNSKSSSSQKSVTNSYPATSLTSYTYADGYTHAGGLGFLGFKTVTSTDYNSGLAVTCNFEYTIPSADGIYQIWLKQQTTTRGGISSSYTSTMGAKKLDITKKSYLAIAIQTVSTDGRTGLVTTKSITDFDDVHGRVTGQTVSTNADNTHSWTISTTSSFKTVSENISRLLSVAETRTNSQDSHTSTVSYSYNDSSLLPSSKTNVEESVTTNFSYDDFGNPTSVSVTSGGITRTSSCAYDPHGRFMVRSTDALGNTSTAEYRYSDGAKLLETDPLGNRTTFSYSFSNGSLFTTINTPDGNRVINALGWGGSMWNSYFTAKTLNRQILQSVSFNSIGQKVGESSTGYKDSPISTSYSYNSDGSLQSETTSGVTTPTMYTYSPDGRLLGISGLNTSISFSYDKLTRTITDNIRGTMQTNDVDVLGNVLSTSSTMGNISYLYNPTGTLKQIQAAGGTTTMEYDALGNQTKLIDPNAGTTTYTYNSFGQLTGQTDAKGQTVTCVYDNPTGLLQSKSGSGGTYESYNYGTAPGTNGRLNSASLKGSNNKTVDETYTYDGLGRVISVVTTGEGKTFTTAYQYNSIGQLFQVTQPTGLILQYAYDNVWNITSIGSYSPSTGTTSPIWDGTSKNASQQWTSYTLGNNLVTKFSYDANYMLQTIQTGTSANPISVQNLGFTFNTLGQLTKRTEGSLIEEFLYDTKNRLTTSTVTIPNVGSKQFTTSYADNGNISSTSIAGTYTYNATPIHAVSDVTGPLGTNLQSPSFTTRTSFTDDNRIDTINNGTSKNVFTYNPSGNRFKVDRYNGSSLTSSKIYVGSSEFIYNGSGTQVCMRTMVYAPTGICAVYQDSAGVKDFHYIHTDYLGSWLKITNGNGTVENTYSYDAWGRPRNPATWDLRPISINDALVNLNSMQPRFDRGYTGHEHMAGFGLINMNGRLYDPYLQRFLSPDNYVQDPMNGQNFNRYSYCLNNPLMYTDPTGWLTARKFDNTIDLLNFCWSMVPFNYGGSFDFENGELKTGTIYDGSGGANGTDGYHSSIAGTSGGSGATTKTVYVFNPFKFLANLSDDRNLTYKKAFELSFTPLKISDSYTPNIPWSVIHPEGDPDLGASGEDNGMSLSPQGLEFIQRHEGFGQGSNHENPYNDDCGYATTGYGHLLHYSSYTTEDVNKYRGMTRDQALVLLNQDLESRVKAVNELVKVKLTQYQFDAIVSFTFNVGIGNMRKGTGLKGSQFLLQLNKSNYDGNLMMNFHTPASLIGRRKDEVNLFMNGKY